MLKPCLICGKNFILKNKNSKYCSRKCFEQSYFKKREVKYPMFKCWNCGHSMQLDFMPTQKRKQFEEFKCPECGQGAEEEDNNICF